MKYLLIIGLSLIILYEGSMVAINRIENNRRTILEHERKMANISKDYDRISVLEAQISKKDDIIVFTLWYSITIRFILPLLGHHWEMREIEIENL